MVDASAQAVGKREAGYRAADMVADGMVVGLGTGSTVFFAMERLAARIREGLVITGIPTSYQTAIRARGCGITLATLNDYPVIDLAIDGADQVDPGFALIKGRGAAQTQEKCVAFAAKSLVIVADPSKMTRKLDAVVPIEVLSSAYVPVIRHLEAIGGAPVLREGVKKDGPVITDNGNMVIDCGFGTIGDPATLDIHLSSIPGVVTCGLFTTFADKTTVVVGDSNGCQVLSRNGQFPL
jgi:ribose 5-phosphate isomerase A